MDIKASVYIATSLDGFIARENGALDWLPGSDSEAVEVESGEQEDYGYRGFFDSIDILVMGRYTFEKVLAFGKWPYETKPVIVLSRTLTTLPTELSGTVNLRSCSPADLLSELQHSGAKRLYIDGGRTIQEFLRQGLIDEITITIIPILIGKGIPLFGPLSKDLKLKHMKTFSFENGFVQSRYEVLK